MDKGFDGHLFYQGFDELGLSYAVRLNHHTNRTFLTPQGKTDVKKLVESLPRQHLHQVRSLGKKRAWRLQVGWMRDVHLPHYRPSGFCTNEPGRTRYSVVVASGGVLGQEPLTILTTVDVLTSDDAARVVDGYLDRWGVEEANRFTKQGFALEDVRALTWTGLKRMAQLVMLAYGFLALLVHGPRRQVERVASTFKSFGPVPEYLFYRLLEGIGRLLRRSMDEGP